MFDDAEPAPYVPVVPVLAPSAGPRVTPVSMPVYMPGVPTGLAQRSAQLSFAPDDEADLDPNASVALGWVAF